MKKPLLFILCLMLFNGLAAQTFDYSRTVQMANHRLLGIQKMVNLTPVQKDALYRFCLNYQLTVDSALYFEKDPVIYSEKCDNASQDFDRRLFTLLTDKQITEYVNVKGSSDVTRKTDEKIETLKESGEYSDSELKKMRKEIYSYLMLEKIVYTRDKYDISKQKENIFRLKTLQPAGLKEAESRRKLKHQGKSQKGKIKWHK